MNKVYQYEIQKDAMGNKCAVYMGENSVIVEKRPVFTDEAGKEYFFVPNFSDKTPFHSFSGRVKDAIESIRNGHGDALTVGNMFGKNESVVRYLDRTYGEALRAKTLEGFKDTQFGYALEFSFLNSFRAGYLIKQNLEVSTVFDNAWDILLFDSEKEAEECKEELLEKVKDLTQKYKQVAETKDEQAIEKFIQHNLSSPLHVLSILFTAIIENEPYKFKTVQTIKRPTEMIH